MKLFFTLLLSICLYITGANAQTDFEYTNSVYSNQIKSIQTLVNGIITSVPVMRLNSSDRLVIQFDDLSEEEDNEFYYKLIHCTKDWEASPIQEIEFVEGFAEERIRDWQLSIGTKQIFTHYWFSLPNRDTRLRISGNYLLLVYDRGNDNTPLFTKRIIVAESAILPNMQWVRPSQTEFIRFNQQLNLSFQIKDVKLINPMRDVYTTVVQNGNWTNAMYNVAPRVFKDGQFTFDQFGLISFPGSNEYRFFDTRTLIGRGWGVKSIDYFIDGYEVLLTPAIRRDQKVYSFNFDFNGNFYVDNVDFFSRAIFDSNLQNRNKLVEFRNNFAYFDALDNEWQGREKDLRSDYTNVIFNLKSPRLDKDVYVFGAITEFQLQPRFKMKYDDRREMYTADILLKQGYYDYLFATEGENGKIDFSITEGSWQDAENEYKTIIYLREFATRYDRVLGVISSNSADYNLNGR
ncbi:MAG: DUF5103 domain-containing protein [Saprospiraceae bacterium]|nr:DUF5103 domain-containing protein [Saprospiraceae bacterium]